MKFQQTIFLTSLVSLMGIGLSASLPSFAQEGKEALYTKSLAATCANCHGTNGAPVAGSVTVPLAGMDRAQFIAQMKAFQSGARPATVMHQLAKGFNDEQINRLAGYFAAQKK